MPELPEVETVVRGMARMITGKTVQYVELRRPDLRVPFPSRMAEQLAGATVLRCRRRAKYALVDFDNGLTMLVHLGMSGRVLLVPDQAYEPAAHDHLLIGFRGDGMFVLNDTRRFGMVYLTKTAALDHHKALSGLGPEPLDPPLSGQALYAALRTKKTSIKAALLDQRVVAGLGNIYISEALFYAGIHPERMAGTLSMAEAGRLADAIRDVLIRAIEKGGSTLKDYRHTDGNLGYFQHEFAVYGKAGEPCPGCSCDVSRTGGIEKIVQAGRATFFCPRRQK